MDVQNLQGGLETVQRQCDAQTGLVHTLQGQNETLTAKVEDLEDDQARLTVSFRRLEEQNFTLDKEAAGVQQSLNTAAHKQQEVSSRPGLHPLHMWLAHTSIGS